MTVPTPLGEEQLAQIRNTVEERIGSMVKPLYVYALVFGIDMHNAAKP